MRTIDADPLAMISAVCLGSFALDHSFDDESEELIPLPPHNVPDVLELSFLDGCQQLFTFTYSPPHFLVGYRVYSGYSSIQVHLKGVH